MMRYKPTPEDDTIAETEVMRTVLWWENQRERDNSENLRIDARKNIKMDSQGIGQDGVDCIHPARYRDEWQAFVSRVRKYGMPQRVGNRSIS
jgi:hypothetical protein